MLTGIVFDWTGTLVTPSSTVEPAFASVAELLAQRLGAGGSADAHRRAFTAAMDRASQGNETPHIERLWADALDWLGVPASRDDVVAVARRFAEVVARGERVYDDARALLPALRYHGFRVGIVANTPFEGRDLHERLRRAGLGGYVDAVLSSADLGFGKPDRRAFEAVMRAMGVEPWEALYVGVEEEFVRGARGALMRAVRLVRNDRARERAGLLEVERLSALAPFLFGSEEEGADTLL